MENKTLNLSIQADLDLLSRTGETERVLEIEVQAPEAEQKQERLALNLAIVLDRSGSMAGEKLSCVKQAAVHLLDLLEAQDRAAVVVYDNEVNVLSPAILLTPENREALKAAVRQVRCGGMTFLSGGWLAGCSEVARAMHDNTVNRVLLLTDGLANVGITDLEELARQSKELCARGVSTSTFGVGADFNEHLLEAMANQGGGIYHFIESPVDIPNIFQQEFKELAAVTARDVEVTLDIPPQVKASVPGSWQAEQNGGQLRIFVGNMVSGRKQPLYVQLAVPPQGDPQSLDGFTIPCLARGKAKEGVLLEARAEVSFKYVPEEELRNAVPKADLLERCAEVAVADAATEALKMDREGDRQGALNHIASAANLYRPHLSQSREHAWNSLVTDLADGMSPMDRKRRQSEAYDIKRMRGRGEEFLLHQPGGHIVIEARGKMILVDTGSPVSVGRSKLLNFLGEDFKLLPSFQNVVDIESLSGKVGMRLDALIGTDILRRCYFTVDARRGLAAFSFEPLYRGALRRIPLKKFMMGVPTARIAANGKALDVFVDTGAVRGYLPEEFAAGCRKTGTAKDFYPGMPDFETPVYEVPFDLAGEKVTLECGTGMPALLELTLKAAGVRGILGINLAQKFVLGFAMPENELALIEKIA